MQNLFECFLATEARFAERVAVIVQSHSGVEEYTYADLRRMAARAATTLRARGLAAGERCALLADNHARWCAAFLGIVGLGAVAVPLDTTLKPAQVATLLRDSGASAIFTSSPYLAAVRTAATACHELRDILMLEDLTPAALQRRGPELPASPARPEDLAAILYTSGTTSDPKGVALTHANLLSETQAVFEVIRVNEEDRILGVLPLFHALALLANFWLPLAAGASVVFLHSISSPEILRAMREREASIFVVVPQFFYLLHQRLTEQACTAGRLRRWLFRSLLAVNGTARRLGFNFGRLLFRQVHEVFGPRLRLLVTGGSRFDPAIGQDFQRLGFTLLQAYGLTECSGAATVTPVEHNRIGSVGRALPGVEIKILPAELNAAESAGSGEVAIRGPIVMQGYYRHPEATAAVLQDGWLLTGDLGYLDRDRNLFVTGRQKDVIVLSSGKNIHPEEVEAHYGQSPLIQELCVLGRTGQPGEPLAERLHAVVVPDFEALRARKVVNAREILRYEIESLSLELPPHKRILSFELWQNELPRTATRKLKRFEIERMLRDRTTVEEAPAAKRALTAEDRTWLAQPRVARACSFIARAARREGDLDPNANLELDLGLDSMQRVELLVTLEQEFGVHLAEEVTSRIYTVGELADALLAAASAPAGAPPGRQGVAWERILAEAPEDDPAFVHILKPKRLLAALLFVLMRGVYVAARVLLRLRVEGVENLPRGRPCILSPNHQSYLDAFLLCSALPYSAFHRLFFLGASDYFTRSLLRHVGRWVNIIPVDPDTNLVRAMQAGAFGLRHGKVLILFPEGERSIDGEPKTFKKGAAILSTHLQVPIVPVALHGIYEVWPRGRRPQRLARVSIRIGEPLPPPARISAGVAEATEQGYAGLTASLRERVQEMFLTLRRLRPA